MAIGRVKDRVLKVFGNDYPTRYALELGRRVRADRLKGMALV